MAFRRSPLLERSPNNQPPPVRKGSRKLSQTQAANRGSRIPLPKATLRGSFPRALTGRSCDRFRRLFIEAHGGLKKSSKSALSRTHYTTQQPALLSHASTLSSFVDSGFGSEASQPESLGSPKHSRPLGKADTPGPVPFSDSEFEGFESSGNEEPECSRPSKLRNSELSLPKFESCIKDWFDGPSFIKCTLSDFEDDTRQGPPHIVLGRGNLDPITAIGWSWRVKAAEDILRATFMLHPNVVHNHNVAILRTVCGPRVIEESLEVSKCFLRTMQHNLGVYRNKSIDGMVKWIMHDKAWYKNIHKMDVSDQRRIVRQIFLRLRSQGNMADQDLTIKKVMKLTSAHLRLQDDSTTVLSAARMQSYKRCHNWATALFCELGYLCISNQMNREAIKSVFAQISKPKYAFSSKIGIPERPDLRDFSFSKDFGRAR